MVQYLYRHNILINTENSFGFNASTEASDKTNFETNFKASAVPISSLELGESVFAIEKNYTDFKSLITSPITWADVRYETLAYFYILYLLSDNPL